MILLLLILLYLWIYIHIYIYINIIYIYIPSRIGDYSYAQLLSKFGKERAQAHVGFGRDAVCHVR